MSENPKKLKNPDDYEVGYKKPPKHSRFPPGVSGRKGRKKAPETQAEIVARIRDEKVQVGDRMVSKFELAVQVTVNQTIKSGKPRDLKLLFDLLDKHGAVPEAEKWAADRAASEKAMARLIDMFDKTMGIDPDDTTALDRYAHAEAEMVMACPQCSAALREQWDDKDRKDLAKRYGKTGLHSQVEAAVAARGKKK